MEIKTIIIQAKEWYDRACGNSYFSATVTVNWTLESEMEFYIPMTCGYGEHYKTAAMDKLIEMELINCERRTNVLWRYCEENNIELSATIQTGCLKREL